MNHERRATMNQKQQQILRTRNVETDRQLLARMEAAVEGREMPHPTPLADPVTHRAASEKQLGFLSSLLDLDLIPADRVEQVRGQMDGMPADRASRYIERLVALRDERAPTFRFGRVDDQWVVRAPANTTAQPGDEVEVAKRNGTGTVTLGERCDANGEVLFRIQRDETRGGPLRDDVPAGRYALDAEEDGHTVFYRVDRPTEGRWAGRVFVKLLIAQGGYGDDELREERVGYRQTAGVLDRIADAGVQQAMERYGRELGSCGHCGRTLTNAESIERGIGPVCAGKMGWS